jgi:phosphoribosylformylglycinamidine (FGAM) synthase PurS component
LNAIEILGVEGVKNVSAGNKFLIIGDVTEENVRKICERVLANGLIQEYSYRKIGGS